MRSISPTYFYIYMTTATSSHKQRQIRPCHREVRHALQISWICPQNQQIQSPVWTPVIPDTEYQNACMNTIGHQLLSVLTSRTTTIILAASKGTSSIRKPIHSNMAYLRHFSYMCTIPTSTRTGTGSPSLPSMERSSNHVIKVPAKVKSPATTNDVQPPHWTERVDARLKALMSFF